MEDLISIFEPPNVTEVLDRTGLREAIAQDKSCKTKRTEDNPIKYNSKRPNNTGKLAINMGNKPGFFVAKALESSEESGVYEEVSSRVESMVEHPYIRRSSIMTEAELKLYRLLMRIIPNDKVIIAPKVRIADILDTYESLKSGPNNPIYKITNKHIDYTICDISTMEPICLVELDDSYHYRNDKIERDKFVESIMDDVNLKLFRVTKRIKDVNESDLLHIKEFLYNRYAPMCAVCGAPMIFKQSRQKSNFGHMFYSCSNFHSAKRCYFTVDIN